MIRCKTGRSYYTRDRVLAVFKKADKPLSPKEVVLLDPSLPLAYTPKLIARLHRDGVLTASPEGYSLKT